MMKVNEFNSQVHIDHDNSGMGPILFYEKIIGQVLITKHFSEQL